MVAMAGAAARFWQADATTMAAMNNAHVWTAMSDGEGIGC
jgi:hypothetical protein